MIYTHYLHTCSYILYMPPFFLLSLSQFSFPPSLSPFPVHPPPFRYSTAMYCSNQYVHTGRYACSYNVHVSHLAWYSISTAPLPHSVLADVLAVHVYTLCKTLSLALQLILHSMLSSGTLFTCTHTLFPSLFLLCLPPSLSHFSFSPSLLLLLSFSPSPSLLLHPLTADIISTVEFNHDGEFLATGDKGGRVVIFQRDGTKMRVYIYTYTHRPCLANSPAQLT